MPEMRLRFGPRDLRVSFAVYLDGKASWAPSSSYDVRSDAPTDVVAMGNAGGMTNWPQLLLINRVTGTAIHISALASLPDQVGHPWVQSTFYVCEPEQ